MNTKERLKSVWLPLGMVVLLFAADLLGGRSNPTASSTLPTTTTASSITATPPPIPTAPPDASKISVGPADIDGYATITGSAGAVPGDVALAVINLSTRSIMTATAGSSGAFSANLFAPPGSSLLIKYSPNPELIKALWHDAFSPGGDFSYMNPLPGATIFVVGSPAGSGIPFHSAGFFGYGEGPYWAGWWIEGGVIGPPAIQAGSQITVTGTFRTTSPAMNCSNPPPFVPQVNIQLRDLFGTDGTARLGGPSFNAYLFTPTGLPIEHEAGGEVRNVAFANVGNLACLSLDTAQGDFTATFTVPAGLADGVYKLEAMVVDGGVPLASGVPRVVIWHHFDPIASLPPLTVGAPGPPRIPWTLFGDYPVNGHRGVQALEDIGRYQMLTRTILPPHRAVVPMLDALSGAPITYRLEPGSNWLSATDRRFPNPSVIPLNLPGGVLQAEIRKPDGSQMVLGPVPIVQSLVRSPSLLDGSVLDPGTGHVGDLFHLYTRDPAFGYTFDQYGPHTILLHGHVEDVYANQYPINLTYEVMVARVLDLDPAQLATTPYKQGDAFAPGLHIFPPVPADVEIRLVHMPFSDPGQAQATAIPGRANRFGYFQPPAGTEIRFESPGEFRVDVSAEYMAPDGTLWAGYVTWGNVVENASPMIEAHGRRGMDYQGTTIDDMPPWFLNANLPADKVGIENYYPYFSGDIHWGDELADPAYKGDSIHSIITLRDLTGSAETVYNLIRDFYPRATNRFRVPPAEWSLAGLEKRLDIGEAPLFMTTVSGRDPTVYPDEIDMWGYWYGSSERPDVHVREIISEDGMGTAYWRFDDTYGYQIGEPANGDQPGDIKWEFGGVVFRVPDQGINEYGIYSSQWVLLPHGCDAFGCARVTPPFQAATGAGINGGPIMSLLGQDVDMLFLPKGVRPGDILELGDTVAFSGHVGPPLDSRVEATITSPGGASYGRIWHANKIGWLYDPTFDFVANEPCRWTVDVLVVHDRPYVGNGVIPSSHNSGTVLGTNGRYEFYVVEPGSPRLFLYAPQPGFITWPNNQVEPVHIRGVAPTGTTAVHYTIHDKGVVMGQGSVTPDASGLFTLVYDAKALHDDFPMLSLTAHEGIWEGLADEVAINLLAVGGELRANTVTLIGEEIFIGNEIHPVYAPMILKR
jgi:hypothetical protein